MITNYPYVWHPEHSHIYKYMNDYLHNKVEFNEELIVIALHQAPNLAVIFLERFKPSGNLRKIALNSIYNDIIASGDFWYEKLYINEIERHKAFSCYIKTVGAALLSIVKHNIFIQLDDWEKEFLVNKIVEWEHKEYAASMLSEQDFWCLSDELRNKLAPLGVAYKLAKAK
jgi:hypothetical protein